MGQSSKKRRSMERLTKAYEEGGMSKELYLKNIEKLGMMNESDDDESKIGDEVIVDDNEENVPRPQMQEPIVPVKTREVEEYVDHLISLGIKHQARREELIIHYMGFDEKHMMKEIGFNGIHTDLMDYFVEKDSGTLENAEQNTEISSKSIREIEALTEPVQTQPVGQLITAESAEDGDDELSINASCKSCGHETHGRNSCRRCGADQVHRVTERKLIAISCVLLLIGAVYLGAASAFSETKISVIGELRETDNFRQIRVVGKVVALINFYDEKYSDTGTIRLLVNDGTGNLYVKIMPDVTEKLIREGGDRIPGFGDTVDCEGSLFVGDDGYMQIKVRDKSLFRVRPRIYTEITIADLVPPNRSSFDVGKQVKVTGQIQGNFYIEGFARILDLVDEEGRSVSIFIPDVIGQLTGELDLDNIYLSRVNVSGALEWYENAQSWEIIPRSTSDIEIISTYQGDAYTTLTVGQLLSNPGAYANAYVQISNVTVATKYQDYLYSVTDATTSDKISIYVDYGANASTGIMIGQRMNCRGWVTYYDSNKNGVPDAGEWEIKIRAMSSDYSLRLSEMGGA
jgi:DNA/RNA endonuclease YhcR with UshA esterase domain